MNNYTIKFLKVEDLTKKTLDWYKNKKVLEFSDNQYKSFSFQSQKEYIIECTNNADLDLYGIFHNNRHIGNITISGFLSFHKRAELSFLIGDVNYWGKGAARYAVGLLCELGKPKYKLNKLYAGHADQNIGCKKVLEYNGFKLEGIRKKHLFYNNSGMIN